MAELVAFIAGALSILSTAPQIIKIMTTNRAKDLSLTTYLMLSMAGFMWIFYAIIVSPNSILFWNAIGTLLSLSIVFLKLSDQYKN